MSQGTPFSGHVYTPIITFIDSSIFYMITAENLPSLQLMRPIRKSTAWTTPTMTKREQKTARTPATIHPVDDSESGTEKKGVYV